MLSNTRTQLANYINSLPRKTIILLAALFTIIIYLFLHTSYYLYYVDDTWEIAKTWNYIHNNISQDVLFRAEDAPDRQLVFCNTYFFVYGNFLEWVGWTKGNAHIFSGIFLLGSAFLWHRILLNLKFSKNLALFFAFSILLFPAFFNASHLTRTDSMAFFIAAASFLLFLKRQHFIAGITVWIAFETHTMGAIGGFYIVAFVLYNWKNYIANLKPSLFAMGAFILGMAIGVYYYYWMQSDVWTWDLFREVLAIKNNMTAKVGNYILTYFFQSRWYRHAWELLFLIITFHLYFKNKLHKQNRFVWIFLAVLIVSTFLTGRENKHYMIFIYPSILLVVAYTYEQLKKLREVAALLAVVFTLLYGLHFWAHKDFHFQEVTEKITEIIPKDDLPVVGMADNWWAVVGREYYPIYHSVDYLPELDIQECYLVRNDYISQHSKNYYQMLDYFNENYDSALLGEIEVHNGNKVEIFHYKKK